MAIAKFESSVHPHFDSTCVMCLILFSYAPESEIPLVVLANRDEFYARGTLQAQFWTDYPDILAGRDGVALGTWLGVTRSGRFAAVTNFRDPNRMRTDVLSRGELTVDFLKGSVGSADYVREVEERGGGYNGFNLLVYDSEELGYVSNMAGDRSSPLPPSPSRLLQPGVYGLSNHLLDTPWPKVTSGKEALKAKIDSGAPPDLSYLQILSDTSIVTDDLLPETGIGMLLERTLSARCIVSPDYGTRCSTMVTITRTGTGGAAGSMKVPEAISSRVQFVEKTLIPAGLNPDMVSFDLITS